MTDLERLYEWMAQRNLTLPKLAAELAIKYNTLWVMAVGSKSISDRFVVRFIRRFGIEEATQVFRDMLSPLNPQV